MSSGGLNKVMLIGNVGKDPELKHTPTGKATLELRMATSESWVSKESGEKQTKTEWHSVIFWGKGAEIIAQFVTKGQKLYVEGKLQTREWEKDGKKNYKTEIVAGDFQFLSAKGEGPRQNGETPAADPNDDLPF
jgi:single-strand DNA-binding protein